MKQTINLTPTRADLDRFASREALQSFYRDKGLDGVELLLCGAADLPEKIPAEDLVGIHLKFWPCWVDFWKQDRRALQKEYDNEETWTAFYGGKDPEVLLQAWDQELQLAQKWGARYVVFHVAECTLGECLNYRFLHSDEAVCDAACQIINRLLDGKNYDFYFLCENLWWSGLTLTRPEVTKRLMDGIHYPKKGIMLDTGHLLHTNNDLRTQEQGIAYIHKILDQDPRLCDYVKGIHLNQSLSGAYVQKALKQPMELTGNYWNRLSQIYPHIFNIDYHKPWTADGIADLIRRIEPEFVTHELITTDLQDHEQALTAQLDAIRRNGGLI